MEIVLPWPCSTSIWPSFVTICFAASLFLAIFFLLSSSILSYRLVQKKPVWPQYQRRSDDKIAGAGVAKIVHVRAANPGSTEGDAHHAFGQRPKWLLHNAQILRPEQSGCECNLSHAHSTMKITGLARPAAAATA